MTLPNKSPNERYWWRRRSLTDEQICQRYAAGQSSSDVALEANCTSTTVLDIARAAGIIIRARGGSERRTLAITDQEIAQRYRDGESGTKLARVAGCHTPTLYQILEAQGVPRRRGGPKPNRRPYFSSKCDQP